MRPNSHERRQRRWEEIDGSWASLPCAWVRALQSASSTRLLDCEAV